MYVGGCENLLENHWKKEFLLKAGARFEIRLKNGHKMYDLPKKEIILHGAWLCLNRRQASWYNYPNDTVRISIGRARDGAYNFA